MNKVAQTETIVTVNDCYGVNGIKSAVNGNDCYGLTIGVQWFKQRKRLMKVVFYMNYYDALYKIARSKCIPIENIGPELGKSARYVGAAKSRGSLPTVGNAAAMLNVCGYELAAIPADSIPDNAIVIDAKAD